MAAISTEGRVFVAQLTRDLAARELAGANALSPGSKRWHDAFYNFSESVSHSKSPTKAAKMVKAGYARLRASNKDNFGCYVNFFHGRSRSGLLEVLTYEVAKHPVLTDGPEGIIVRAYFYMLRRNGSNGYGRRTVAFLSWHALARLRERSDVDLFAAGGVVVACGMAGYLMGESAKHIGTEINIALGRNILCTGPLRSAIKTDAGKQNGTPYEFFDVLTVLPLDAVYYKRRDQGRQVTNAVYNYMNSADADPTGIADKIDVLPFHQNDYVSRSTG